VASPETDRLLEEIAEQPRVVRTLIERQWTAVQRIASAMREREPSAIVLVARGSSDNAAVYGRYLFEVCNRRLTSLAAPSGLTLYGRSPRLDDTAVIGVSQSGQGEDVVAYLREARQQGAATVAIVNDEESPLARAAEYVLGCLAGPEVSVPATKTVTAQMTLLAMLSVAIENAAARPAPLANLPTALDEAVHQREKAQATAKGLARTTLGSVIGRGFAFPPSLEIALKLKETSYTRAEPFSAADFLHGPVALVDETFSALLVDVGGRSSQAARDMAAAVEQRGGQVAHLQAGRVEAHGSGEIPTLTLHADVDEPYAPIIALVLGQLLAVELAVALGLDPGRPRGLRKVTSTR
jgi:glucosamine--fructose-6-phosphate aminotransferase (isomerizing)